MKITNNFYRFLKKTIL